jgi:hypothetical protein
MSAEGVQEVVAAFKKISDEAAKAGKGAKSGGDGISFLSEQFGGLVDLLPQLSLAAAVAGIGVMTKTALESADAMGKLAQKTGLSVETISTLSFASRTANVDSEELQKSLIKFTKTMDDYDQGVQSVRDATKNLFGDQKALEGLDEDARLKKIIERLAQLEPGYKRTGAAVAFFGKQGADLLPLIDDLGQKGLPAIAEAAKKAGLAIDENLVKAAQEANDAFANLHALADGMATQFTAGLAPALAETAKVLTEAVSQDGTNGFKILGEVAGSVLKGIIVSFADVALDITKVLGRVISLAVNAGTLVKDVFTGRGIKSSWEEFKANIIRDADALDKTLNDKRQAISSKLNGSSAPGTGNKPRDKERSDNDAANQKALQDARKLADARLALTEATLSAELAIQKAKNAALLDDEKNRFDQGLVGIQKYFDDRRAIVQGETAKEIAIIQKQIGAEQERLKFEQTRPLAKNETEGDRQAKVLDIQKNVVKLQSDADVKHIQSQEQIAGLNNDQLTAVREASQAELAAIAQILEAEGKQFDAERVQLQAQIAGMQRLKGESDAAFEARKQALSDAGIQKIDFSQIVNDGRAALFQLDQARQEIQNKVASGKLFEVQAEEQIRQLEQDRLPLLQLIAQQMQAAAITPEQIQAAAEFAQEINGIAIASDHAATVTADFKKQLQDALTNDLANFFTQGIESANSFGDAMRGLALSVVQSLQQIIAKIIATMLITKLLKSVGLGGIIPGLADGGLVVKAASGGLITGPGSGTSDSIMARLSNGEFVMRAAAVRQIGLDTLQSMNELGGSFSVRSMRGHFAAGGLVEADQGSGATNAGLTATLDLNEGLLLKRLEAHPDFKRVIVRTAENNRKAINSALGKGPNS